MVTNVMRENSYNKTLQWIRLELIKYQKEA